MSQKVNRKRETGKEERKGEKKERRNGTKVGRIERPCSDPDLICRVWTCCSAPEEKTNLQHLTLFPHWELTEVPSICCWVPRLTYSRSEFIYNKAKPALLCP